jgi:hypothetical protein
MKLLIATLLMAASVQAQSIADAARKERDRQAGLKPTVVISSAGNSSSAPAPPKEVPKLQPPTGEDAVKLWNEKAELLRTKIRMLQDQEMALQLQQTDLQNQVYATVVEQAIKDQAQAQLAQNQQQLAKTREDLDAAKKELDAMQAEGPPKK